MSQMLTKEAAADLLHAIQDFTERTEQVLSQARVTMTDAEWQAFGKTLTEVWTATGDRLLYPIFDMFPELDTEGFPRRVGLARTWGPLRHEDDP